MRRGFEDLNNVEKLEDKALQQMWGLKEITIGAFVNKIGEGAFTGCTSLIAIKAQRGFSGRVTFAVLE